MDMKATVDAIIKEAKIKPIEERAVVLSFGLRGEPRHKLNEMVEIFRADETITVKNISREWVRTKEARALHRMRSAMLRLKIDMDAFRGASSEEPYRSLCEVLIGFEPNK